MDVGHHLSEAVVLKFREGIRLILSRWPSLRFAVEYEFGVPVARFSPFMQGPIYIDDLEDMLGAFLLSLNTHLDNGINEEVTEKLMILYKECYEECLEGNHARTVSIPPIMQAASKDEDSNMVDGDVSSSANAVNASESQHDMIQRNMMKVAELKLGEPAEAEDGWTVVSRNRRD